MDILGDGLLLGGGEDGRIELDALAVERAERIGRQGNVNLNWGRIWESCGNCLDGDRRRRGGRRVNVNGNVNVLRWMLG